MEGKLEEIKELKEKITELEAKKQGITYQYWEKIKPLQEQIDKLREEKKGLIDPIEKSIEEMKQQIRYAEMWIKNERKKAEFEAFMSGGEMTEKAIEFMIGLKEDDRVDINIRGGKLPNGIRIVRVIDDGFRDDGDMRYLAFYGTKLIGIWTRRRAEHRGDETTAYAFLTTLEGKTAPSDHNFDIQPYYLEDDIKDSLFNVLHEEGEVITYEKFKELAHKFGWSNVDAKPLTYNNWKKYLKSLTQEELENAPAMDIDKPVCQKILTEWGWMW